LSEASARVTKLRDQLDACRSGLGDQLSCLIRDRDQLQDGIDQLQGWYDDLLASGRDSADKLRQGLLEDIPAAADELQVLVLKLKEDLISERVNREHLERRYKSEADFERQKLLSESEQLRQTQECLQAETDRCDRLRSELAKERSAKEAAQSQLSSLQEKSREVAANLRASEAELKARTARLETDNAELRHRVTCLQTELQNSESVQKDFVELSQSLQMQLENLRQQESQVRWQFVEDASNCGACGRGLSLTVKPRRCLHCVKLFCQDCTAKTVTSGPSKRQANVCEFCHTLVVKDAVPYFSVRAPANK
uniref:FYVE-type domain-containing protein n=2 Tax=Macrostomum lignano TaxID=282301 RepID=A0A1I8GQT0_9PLAT